MNATKMRNTAMERQLYELSESVRFLKLSLLLKCTDWFKPFFHRHDFASKTRITIF